MNTKRRKNEVIASGAAWVPPPPKPKKEKNAPTSSPPPKPPATIAARVAAFALPAGAKLVGCDPGIVNVGGFVREEDIKKPFTITTASYYHDTGIRPRQKLLAEAEEKERRDALGALTPFGVAEKAVSEARTKTGNLDRAGGGSQDSRAALPHHVRLLRE